VRNTFGLLRTVTHPPVTPLSPTPPHPSVTVVRNTPLRGWCYADKCYALWEERRQERSRTKVLRTSGMVGPDEAQRFSEVYLVHRGDVFSYLLRRVTPDVGLADDLTSETFCRAWHYWPSYRDDGKPRAWLLRIARSALIDRVRQRDVQPANIREQPCPWAQSDFLKVEDDEWFGQLVSELTETQQEIMRLTEAGYPPSEIARMTGNSELAVRQMKLRALRSLKRHLSK
jgi:RNA polymerase sigma-70 factor, ECF subfamily